jgi:hypothetical protein
MVDQIGEVKAGNRAAGCIFVAGVLGILLLVLLALLFLGVLPADAKTADCPPLIFNVSQDGRFTVANLTENAFPTGVAMAWVDGEAAFAAIHPELPAGSRRFLGQIDEPPGGWSWLVTASEERENCYEHGWW